MNAIAAETYNATLGQLVGRCQRLLEPLRGSAPRDRSEAVQLVEAQKAQIETELARVATEATPEVGVILDSRANNSTHALDAFWLINGVVEPYSTGCFLADKSSWPLSGTFAVTLAVGRQIKCTAVGGIFTSWVVTSPVGVAPFLQDAKGAVSNLTSSPGGSFGQGECILSGHTYREPPPVLYPAVTQFAEKIRIAGMDHLDALYRLWTGKADMCIEPWGGGRPTVKAAEFGFARALDLVSLRLQGDTLFEHQPVLNLVDSPREYWTVTVRRAHLIELSKYIPVVPLP